MEENAANRSKLSSWAGGVFVAAVFLLVWVGAVMRLHRHFDGEALFQRGGVVDSLLAVLAPLAIGVQLLRAGSALKGRKTLR